MGRCWLELLADRLVARIVVGAVASMAALGGVGCSAAGARNELLDASELQPPPSECAALPPGVACQPPLYRTFAFPSNGSAAAGGDANIAGATCVTAGRPAPGQRGATCAKLRIEAGTRFRLRAVV